MVFSNTHDGSGAVKTALTPIRVVCNNTLNLALRTAKRSWSMIHTGDISGKIEEAKNTLFLADEYMSALGKEFENLRGIRLSEKQVMDYIEILLPVEENFTPQQKRGIERLREDMRMRYFDAPDLKRRRKQWLPLYQCSIGFCNPFYTKKKDCKLQGEYLCQNRRRKSADRQGISDGAGSIRRNR